MRIIYLFILAISYPFEVIENRFGTKVLKIVFLFLFSLLSLSVYSQEKTFKERFKDYIKELHPEQKKDTLYKHDKKTYVVYWIRNDTNINTTITQNKYYVKSRLKIYTSNLDVYKKNDVKIIVKKILNKNEKLILTDYFNK